MRSIFMAALMGSACSLQIHAQQQHDHSMHQMAGMSHEQQSAEMFLMNQASGTGMNPRSWTMPMLSAELRKWRLMFMGQAFLIDMQQSGPRGADKLFVPNWFMLSAQHSIGKGSVMLTLMPSLEPLTVTHRRYPELFQTGETAYGRPIADGQHPHEFIMGLGVQYARPLGDHTTAQIYFAPVGDPALGPVAFPHRASAMELPLAPLNHHWADSTHIANEVLTVGVMHRWLRFEVSGFHGAEPDENRWNIDYGAIDSVAGRISIFPTSNWMAQFSIGRLAQPERSEPEDVVRATASIHYTRPLRSGDWSTSLIWGRNHKTRNTDSLLVETLLPASRRNILTARVESVQKDELFPGNTFRIGAYTVGYMRDVSVFRHLQTGLGASASFYSLPGTIKPFYGDHPFGVTVYLRVRLRSVQAGTAHAGH